MRNIFSIQQKIGRCFLFSSLFSKAIAIGVTFLLFTPFCYAQLDLAEPPADGIYRRDDIAIKFIPPPGWKIQSNSFQKEYGQVVFRPSSFDFMASLGISVVSRPLSMTVTGADILESTKREMDKDETVLKAEIITFADTKALSSVTSISGIKIKQIQFYTDKNMHMFTFLAEEENFDKLLPAVDESLKSFKIVSPVPEKRTPESMDLSLSPSKELFEKFKSISDKLCLALVVKHNEIAEMHGKGLDEKRLREMANTASLEIMTRYKNAFIISDTEAKIILSGEYNNVQNKKDIESYIFEFEKLNVMLPLPITYLIFRYNERLLRDLDLEFTARLFKEYLRQE